MLRRCADILGSLHSKSQDLRKRWCPAVRALAYAAEAFAYAIQARAYTIEALAYAGEAGPQVCAHCVERDAHSSGFEYLQEGLG